MIENPFEALFLKLSSIESNTKILSEKIDSLSQESKANNDMLTIQQFSEEYNLCRSTIHKFMKDGRLKYHKFGRKTLFKREDIERCLITKGKHM
ncbi:helix-turn-helix domain-containing protein [Flammeovirga pacifica]|uniref:Helix-turn-helix domain-containing protein n=1 Tax=Flammeovirga pacifica TaxID=915059 RepID=A0A1S1YVT2_FLAPC|nr:helix-turn-helix domain-containing protein [Flammeovirga pacifica]OHX65127.1 hypothetical protein NH26_01535 [Flammeovirga pacifica]